MSLSKKLANFLLDIAEKGRLIIRMRNKKRRGIAT